MDIDISISNSSSLHFYFRSTFKDDLSRKFDLFRKLWMTESYFCAIRAFVQINQDKNDEILPDSLWISKACGDDVIVVVNYSTLLDNLGKCFAGFLNTTAATSISYLKLLEKHNDDPQIFAGFIRITIIFGTLCPAILIPCIRPLMEFYKATDKLINLVIEYN